MAFHHSPKIETSGLIFLNDYDNPKGWMSGSLYWTDLITNINSKDVYTSHSQFDSIGRPTFTGGLLPCVIYFTGSTAPGSLQNNFTVQMWWRRDGDSGKGTSGVTDSYHTTIYGIGNGQLIITKGGTYAGWWGRISGASVYAFMTSNESNYPVGTWRFTSFVKSSEISGTVWYLDDQINTIKPDYTASLDTAAAGITFGRNDAYTPNGPIAMSMVYNRTLSYDEIKRNYNATKHRFK